VLAPRAVEVRRVAAALAGRFENQVRAAHRGGAQRCGTEVARNSGLGLGFVSGSRCGSRRVECNLVKQPEGGVRRRVFFLETTGGKRHMGLLHYSSRYMVLNTEDRSVL
jgi:hypothetical protein